MPNNRIYKRGHDAPELLQAYESYCRHEATQRDLAAQLGMNPQTLSRYFRELAVKLHAEHAENIAQVRMGQTIGLRKIADEALRAWEASKGESITVHERTTKDGQYRETTTTSSTGNPAYLTAARGALADIRSIWGAEAPKAVQVEVADADALPAQRLDAIAEKMKALVPQLAEVEVVQAESNPVDTAITPVKSSQI